MHTRMKSESEASIGGREFFWSAVLSQLKNRIEIVESHDGESVENQRSKYRCKSIGDVKINDVSSKSKYDYSSYDKKSRR
jgi:hypothetical protein